MTAECAICRKFQPIQLDLSGAEAEGWLYLCYKCQEATREKVIVFCSDDNMRLDLTAEEAAKVFSSIPPRRIAIVSSKAREKMIEKLLSEDDKAELRSLRAGISERWEIISSLETEISDLKSEIDDRVKEAKSIMTYRLEKREAGR
jgi:hypothetical protein